MPVGHLRPREALAHLSHWPGGSLSDSRLLLIELFHGVCVCVGLGAGTWGEDMGGQY